MWGVLLLFMGFQDCIHPVVFSPQAINAVPIGQIFFRILLPHFARFQEKEPVFNDTPIILTFN